jgi:hypothetical protein
MQVSVKESSYAVNAGMATQRDVDLRKVQVSALSYHFGSLVDDPAAFTAHILKE